MKKFEVWMKDKRTEVVDETEVWNLIYKLENFDREDVDYIYELDNNNNHVKEVWNDWEGLI